jgi:hypothetical protein
MSISSMSQAIDHAGAAADSLLARAQRLVDQARALTEDQKKGLPRFRGSWQRSDVEDYLARLQEALRSPVVYRSRQLLQDCGITADRVPAEVLEDGSKVQSLLSLLEQLGPVQTQAKPVVGRWLMDAALGLEHAVERLTSIDKAELENIARLQLPRNLINTYLTLALEDGERSASERATRLASDLEHLREYHVKSPSRRTPIYILEHGSRQLVSEIELLEDIYSLPESAVVATIKMKDIDQALDITSREIEKRRQELENLTGQWHSLSQSLASVGESAGDQPHTLDGLRSRTGEMEQRCAELIGLAGKRILDFLRGADEFPGDLGFEDLKEGLTRLRPLIMKDWTDA